VPPSPASEHAIGSPVDSSGLVAYEEALNLDPTSMAVRGDELLRLWLDVKTARRPRDTVDSMSSSDPIGKRLFRPESRRPSRNYADVDRIGYPQTIVGLVREAYSDSVREPAPPTYNTPLVQVGVAPLAVRTAGDPQAVIAGVRDAVRRYGRSLRTIEVQLETALVNHNLIRERVLAVLRGFFGGGGCAGGSRTVRSPELCGGTPDA
jgi:hypothetical protein